MTYCFHCGAPQVLLGQELRELAEAQQATGSGNGVVAVTPPEDPTAIQWQPMLRLAMAVSACFAIFVFLLPPLSLLVPAITLSLYASRYRYAKITAGLGARIGLLCGLLVVGMVAAMSTVSSVLMRLRTQELSSIDTGINAIFQQWHDQMTAQQMPDVAGVTATLNIPEFRAGIVLCAVAMTMLFFLAAISAAGALAGFARSRAAQRPAA